MFSSLIDAQFLYYVIMTLVSIVLFCVETLPVFAMTHCVKDELPNFADPFIVIETVCTAWFTLEMFVRFAGCPSKFEFCKDLKNLVDVGAILPYYVTLINVLLTMSCEGAKSSASLAFLRVTRLWYCGRTVSPGSFVVRLGTTSSRRDLSQWLDHKTVGEQSRDGTDRLYSLHGFGGPLRYFIVEKQFMHFCVVLIVLRVTRLIRIFKLTKHSVGLQVFPTVTVPTILSRENRFNALTKQQELEQTKT